MRQASETVSNLQNQISETGETVMSRIRRPRNIPRSDESLIPLKEGELRWENEMAQNEQNRKAANTITAALKRKKVENTIAFEKITKENERLSATNTIAAALKRRQAQRQHELDKFIANERLQRVQQGQQVFENMQQEQYNQYLQDDAASNFLTLSKKALKQQQKELQKALKTGKGESILQDIKQVNAVDNFGILSTKALNNNKKNCKRH